MTPVGQVRAGFPCPAWQPGAWEGPDTPVRWLPLWPWPWGFFSQVYRWVLRNSFGAALPALRLPPRKPSPLGLLTLPSLWLEIPWWLGQGRTPRPLPVCVLSRVGLCRQASLPGKCGHTDGLSGFLAVGTVRVFCHLGMAALPFGSLFY